MFYDYYDRKDCCLYQPKPYKKPSPPPPPLGVNIGFILRDSELPKDIKDILFEKIRKEHKASDSAKKKDNESKQTNT